MTDDGFVAFYAGSYHRLLGQLFAVTGDLAEAVHHLVGLPVEQVARELRLAPGTVKSRLARGRAALAGMLRHDRSEVT